MSRIASVLLRWCTQYGYTDTPGRWDHWPSGFVFTGGADDSIDGKVVIASGDILLPHKLYVQSPIELTIEQGRIVDIRGGVDADLLRDYMESFDDERAYGISHIGWGLDHRARWSGFVDRLAWHGHGTALVLRQRPLLDRPQR